MGVPQPWGGGKALNNPQGVPQPWGAITPSISGPTSAAPQAAVPIPGHPEVGTPWMPTLTSLLSPAADGGGTIAHWLDADYLFSSDATHPDTRSIHESLSYLEGRATVFHSCYLSVCAGTGAGEKPSVVLGHFVLPPACLQEEIRSKIGRFIWEKADALEEQPNRNLPEEPEAARNGCEEEPEEEALDLAESEETDSEALAQGEFPYRALQEYPTNNMVTGYASARDMKKYEGELHDFTPGTSGYAAYWVQSKFSIYCEKTKMKKKL
ncbi:telomere repeats-binding bouquet formation protein 2 isoform X2 [Poecile atricapillus]|uniref:telomere repeats-binding bouquet formation protein 2 isoform X2 n=1 Tax=Poecile atricapillus TaxID=48891 RepID=UPI002738C96B|nr:telomere repeats-binding bouquet formation protein 2 isoform X2 [Poecile atricapillus]